MRLVIGTAAARKGKVGLQKKRASPYQMLIKPPQFMVEREATLVPGDGKSHHFWWWFKMKHCWQAYNRGKIQSWRRNTGKRMTSEWIPR